MRGTVKSLGADCIEKEMRPEHIEALAGLLEEGGPQRRQAEGVPPLRLGPQALQFQHRQRGRLLMTLSQPADHAAQVRHLRRLHAVRDPPRRDDRHLRHPRRRRQAQGPALRRPAVPRRLHVALSARRLSREVLDQRRARHALRQEADRAEDPDHHRRHELRLALGQRQGSARPRRHAGRHLDDDRRRRHDAGGARPVARRWSTSICPRATA